MSGAVTSFDERAASCLTLGEVEVQLDEVQHGVEGVRAFLPFHGQHEVGLAVHVGRSEDDALIDRAVPLRLKERGKSGKIKL